MIDTNRLDKLLQTSIYDIRMAYWFSSTEEAQTPTEDYVPDQAAGYWTSSSLGRVEHDRLAQMPTAPGSSALSASPYTTRLRPMTDTSFLTTAQKIVVTKIHFRAYDHRLTGAAEQDALTNAAIDASLLTNNAYATSRFRGGIISDWSVNWFRPAFIIGGVNVLRDLALPSIGSRDEYGNLTTTNAADLSVGIPCPWEFNDLYAVINNNDGHQVTQPPQVYAQLAQYIPTTGKYVRYPVKCIAEFAVAQGDRQV